MRRSIWYTAGEERSRLDLDRPLRFKRNGSGKIVPTEEQHADCLTVMPIAPVRQVVGVALVPEQTAGQIARNGMALEPGLHELRHADRLDVNGQTFWISVELSAEETKYDPEKHSPDAFCFLTKARLNEGDAVTICPGTPDTSCGVIYKQAAWEMAQKSATPFRCPNCGFDPARATWAPPVERSSQSLDQLFQIAAQGNTRSHETKPTNAG